MTKKFDRLEEFIEILVQYEREDPFPIFAPSIDAQFAINCLTEGLLGPDYYISVPVCNGQANAIILDEILRTYSKDYRRLVKKKQKELRNK